VAVPWPRVSAWTPPPALPEQPERIRNATYAHSGAVASGMRTALPGLNADVVSVTCASALASNPRKRELRFRLAPITADLAGEIDRILSLGASLLTEMPVLQNGWLRQILADPDGNELCVLQPPANRDST
jgi:hypothetical protein